MRVERSATVFGPLSGNAMALSKAEIEQKKRLTECEIGDRPIRCHHLHSGSRQIREDAGKTKKNHRLTLNPYARQTDTTAEKVGREVVPIRMSHRWYPSIVT